MVLVPWNLPWWEHLHQGVGKHYIKNITTTRLAVFILSLLPNSCFLDAQFSRVLPVNLGIHSSESICTMAIGQHYNQNFPAPKLVGIKRICHLFEQALCGNGRCKVPKKYLSPYLLLVLALFFFKGLIWNAESEGGKMGKKEGRKKEGGREREWNKKTFDLLAQSLNGCSG